MCVNGKLIGIHQRATELAHSRPHVPQTEGSQIGNHRLSTSWGVVERLDHHCGDDLVTVLWFFLERVTFIEHRLSILLSSIRIESPLISIPQGQNLPPLLSNISFFIDTDHRVIFYWHGLILSSAGNVLLSFPIYFPAVTAFGRRNSRAEI